MSSRLVADAAGAGPAGAPRTTRSFRLRALLILWPAFLMAGVLEALVFAVVDPTQLRWFGGDAIEWSRMTIYSVTFLIIWGAIATSGAISELLASPSS